MISAKSATENIIVDVDRFVYTIGLSDINNNNDIPVELVCLNTPLIQEVYTNLGAVIDSVPKIREKLVPVLKMSCIPTAVFTFLDTKDDYTAVTV